MKGTYFYGKERAAGRRRGREGGKGRKKGKEGEKKREGEGREPHIFKFELYTTNNST